MPEPAATPEEKAVPLKGMPEYLNLPPTLKRTVEWLESLLAKAEWETLAEAGKIVSFSISSKYASYTLIKTAEGKFDLIISEDSSPDLKKESMTPDEAAVKLPATDTYTLSERILGGKSQNGSEIAKIFFEKLEKRYRTYMGS